MGFDHTITRYCCTETCFPLCLAVHRRTAAGMIDLFRCAEAIRPEGFSYNHSDGLLR